MSASFRLFLFPLSRRVCRRGFRAGSKWRSSAALCDQLDWSAFMFGDDLQKPVQQPNSPKLLKVAIVGLPNTGKSTLVNSLSGQKVAIVSDKCQTTRESAITILTEESNQIVLIDTPGVVPFHYGRKLKMPHSLMTGAKDSLLDVDLALVLVDASNKRHQIDLGKDVMGLLKENSHLPSVLVLNKVDVVRQKSRLLLSIEALTRGALAPKLLATETGIKFAKERETGLQSGSQEEETGWPRFSEVMMVSATTGEGVNTLKEFLFDLAYPSDWLYPGGRKTISSPSKIVADVIREKLLVHLYHELPYVVKQETMWLSRQEGVLHIHQALNCNKESQKSIIIGPRGRTIQNITAEAQVDLELALQCPVELKLFVRVDKNLKR
ncbi:GTPase Era, mitochondrial-like [Oscarella lobularis]|uniref:GTPase Era, mitochondrial-like n=1 Tax=Oscarella lobularis TaxID=121494 RepID=UPI0033130B2D